MDMYEDALLFQVLSNSVSVRHCFLMVFHTFYVDPDLANPRDFQVVGSTAVFSVADLGQRPRDDKPSAVWYIIGQFILVCVLLSFAVLFFPLVFPLALAWAALRCCYGCVDAIRI